MIPSPRDFAAELLASYGVSSGPRKTRIFDPPVPDFDSHFRTSGGIPWLEENGLPYPTHFQAASHEAVSLDGRWICTFDDGDEEEIGVPSTINAASGGRVDCAGPVVLRRRLTDPGTIRDHVARGGKVRLRLEGFLQSAAVFFDGELVAARRGGYTPLFADVGKFFAGTASDVDIHILLDARPDFYSLPARLGPYNTPGWHTYLGIHRETALELLPGGYLFKAAIDPLPGERLRISLVAAGEQREFRLECRYQCSEGELEILETLPAVFDGGAGVSTSVSELHLPGVLPYESHEPHQIRMQIRAENPHTMDFHEVVVFTGYRLIETGPEGIVINGRRRFLKGISKHEDHPDHGASNPSDLVDADLSQIKDLHANYIRLAHYPHHPRELDAARDRGFWLAEEIPFYQLGNGYVHWYADHRPFSEMPLGYLGMRQAGNRRVVYEASRQIAEMVERDRNNPSLILWGVANESYSLSRRSARLYRRLAEVVRTFDRTRPVTMAEFTSGIDAIDRMRQGNRHLDLMSYNVYYGWYYRRLDELGECLDAIHRRFPAKPLLLSEFGAGAARGRTRDDGEFIADRVPPGKTYSEEEQRDVLAAYLNAAMDRDWVTGVSPWVFSDFYCVEFPNNPIPNYNLKGITDARRRPKLAYEYLRSRYRDLPD
jgi:beta-glucuronidase